MCGPFAGELVFTKTYEFKERGREVGLSVVISAQSAVVLEVLAGKNGVHVAVIARAVHHQNRDGVFGKAARSKVVAGRQGVAMEQRQVNFVVRADHQVDHGKLVRVGETCCPHPLTHRCHACDKHGVFVLISGFVDRFKFSKGHVACIAFCHVAVCSGDDDGSVTQAVHGIDAIESAAGARNGFGPRAVFIDPGEEKINPKIRIFTGKADDVTVEFNGLFKHSTHEHAAVGQRNHAAHPLIICTSSTGQPAAGVVG